MDSPIYSQDEFDLNLPFHHHQLKEKFHFLLEKSIASTKGSPLFTPDESVIDLKTNFGRKFKLEAKKKAGKKIDVLASNTTLGDMVSSKAALVIPKLVKTAFFNFVFQIFFLGCFLESEHFKKKNRKEG